MSRVVRGRTRVAALGATGALALAAMAGCDSSSHQAAPPPVRPAPVALTSSITRLPGTVHVGLIVSLQVPPGQGGTWAGAASGAQVAAYRYALGRQHLELDVVDDHGTSAGAVAAVKQLVGEHVSGIVAATEGSHLTGALTTAAADRTAVLLPYDSISSTGLPATTWLTGPSQEQVASGVLSLLEQQKFTNPVVITDDTAALPRLSNSPPLSFDATSGTALLVRQLRQAAGAEHHDAAVLDLPAETAAKAVAALQSADISLPVVLTRQALSPEFGQLLQAAGGSLSGQLLAIGEDTGDVTSLAGDGSGRRAAAFLTAVAGAARSGRPGLFDSGSFSATAGAADIASHDAVVAVAVAAAKARSTDAAKVLTALAGATVSTRDGLAGPPLTFTAHAALPSSEVTGLAATSQSPGARPASAGDLPKLFWFPITTARGQ